MFNLIHILLCKEFCYSYVPWNLHEPYPGKYVFDGILNLR